ncbi:MAG: valine--tRNA ligase, partial [Gammaproteobacteria bacterium]
VTVATTRPETMLGDTAVAVNPGDERFRHLVGRDVELPLAARRVPIINIFTVDAVLNENAPLAYRGLDRFAARARIVSDLTAAGLLEKTQKHRMMVPRGDRSGTVIEPYLTEQWYVRIAPLTGPAIRAVEEGRIRFVPDNWTKTYYEWMRNIQDWCISRQLWWGHRIPAWYGPDGKTYVGRSEDEVRARHKLPASFPLKQDEDVLDTWFSSALWPFSTLGWPEQTPELKTFYPTSVLVTGFDIIFFWVARMIMMGLRFMDAVPFREVYIHGLVRDADGQKMSKSKGNILDPLDLVDGIRLDALVEKRTSGLLRPQDKSKIEKATRREFPDGIESYGTDALRFTFASLASPGRNINFDVGRIGGHRNFCNKLWNAARYVLMNAGDEILPEPDDEMEFGAAERWIRSRLRETIRRTTDAILTYRFDLAAQTIQSFTWDEYCDWYLELSKPVLTDPAAAPGRKRGSRFTLFSVLEILLRLAHPVMPFITEEIWHQIAPRCGRSARTIMLQRYPLPDEVPADPESVREIDWLKAFILGVRRIRGEMNIEPARLLPVCVNGGGRDEIEWLKRNTKYLKSLARLESIEKLETDMTDAATALAGDMTIFIPFAELIDPRAEIDRLNREIGGRQAELDRVQGKLANGNFIERAPAAVVEKERRRREELADIISRLEKQIGSLQGLLRADEGN